MPPWMRSSLSLIRSIRFGHALLGRMRVPVISNLHRCFVSRTWIGLGQIYGGFATNQVSSALVIRCPNLIPGYATSHLSTHSAATSRSPILPTEKEV
ncbi:uncharacterized protein CLUP02_12480 [Colletotrichum lupini]|uniref:Secreted protein n=2 Tax=Colletotrichum acutatum species complex TaxID=2707335 RepID=A0A9Q8WKH8_9PEZI|nr:uncharacterized protein CLUP02_12480 [Colletotrichum lupini]XP_060382609.1 uncharacterized protein CTAM01_06738 [Colletotrichum tamarilloi]KAI3548525.1 hypothetical protein CSPX01_02954 [Colletotrichum filicis]KAK1500139.1 hypothetical protein CTAM01_06738 [Colletotrichum tamarilloi]UQC86978.1 hypothetical protein CLUP02_12480 [Colletotrichum lupini]